MSAKTNLVGRVAQLIQEDFIETGRVQPGERLPTMRDLGARYGASLATVAYAVAQLETEGVLRKASGERPVVQPPVPEDFAPVTIGLAVPMSGNAHLVSQMLRGVDRACRGIGAHFVTAVGQEDYASEPEEIDRLVSAGCEAVVLNPWGRLEEELRNDYLNRDYLDLPIVLLDMGNPEHARPQVGFDNYRAGYDMAQSLLALGHRRIAFTQVGDEGKRVHWPSNLMRRRGWVAALRDAGLRPGPHHLWDVRSDHADLPELLERWRNQHPGERATALMAVEDQGARLVVREARAQGVEVPGDLFVTGFDNTAEEQFQSPLYLTTAPEFAHAAELAVDLAVRYARGERVRHVSLLLPAPVLRKESDPAP